MSRDHRGLSARDLGEIRENPERARWVLADLAGRALSGVRSLDDSGPRVVRLEIPVGHAEPLLWLREQSSSQKSYWSGRNDGVEVAAAGAADVHEGEVSEKPSDLKKRLSPVLSSGDPRLRYYGGLRFDPEREPGSEWRALGAYRFVLPRFEMISYGVETTLACNLVLPDDTDFRERILEEIEGLSFARNIRRERMPGLVSRTNTPEFGGWKINIEAALADFEAGRLDKTVLARRAKFEFDGEVDPIQLAHELKRSTPDCFHFYFEPQEGTAFFGASPERLFRREGSTIFSEAVAGTRPRGASEADDRGLREELLSSEKDRAEHGYVRANIREALTPLCDGLKVEERASEMKLTRRRHMVSGVRGTLREGVSDAEVLEALHPTPAVGGYPKRKALARIRELEHFDRGWYAGPVGWIGANASEFAVGIRSALLSGREVSLYSGAGIVAGSTARDEWAEIEQKIADFTRIFGLEPGNRQG